MVRIWLAVAFTVLLLQASPIAQADNVTGDASTTTCPCGFDEESLAGSWASDNKQDGYVASIGTGAAAEGGATGPFTKKTGRWKLFPDANKFQKIRYVSENRWEGEQLYAFKRSGKTGTRWVKAVFSLEGPNRMLVKAETATYRLSRVGAAVSALCAPCDQELTPAQLKRRACAAFDDIGSATPSEFLQLLKKKGVSPFATKREDERETIASRKGELVETHEFKCKGKYRVKVVVPKSNPSRPLPRTGQFQLWLHRGTSTIIYDEGTPPEDNPLADPSMTRYRKTVKVECKAGLTLPVSVHVYRSPKGHVQAARYSSVEGTVTIANPLSKSAPGMETVVPVVCGDLIPDLSRMPDRVHEDSLSKIQLFKDALEPQYGWIREYAGTPETPTRTGNGVRN